MKLVKLLLASCLAFAACGESAQTQNEFLSSIPLVEVMANAQCDRIFVCCDQAELEIVLGGLETIDKATCVRNLTKQLSAFFGPGIEAAQKKNRVSLDTSQFASCGDAIRTQSCENISNDDTQIQRFEACQKAVLPEQEAAGFCDNDYECDTGFCVETGEGGSCKNVPKIGQPCQSLRCSYKQFCDEKEICRLRGKDGTTCLKDASCESGGCDKETNTCQTRVGLCDD